MTGIARTVLHFALVVVMMTKAISADEVCYPPYGCFSDDAPYDETLVQLPMSPDELDTKFMLFNRTYRQQPYAYLSLNDIRTASKVNFNNSKKIVFVTHGYIGSLFRWWIQMMLDELLKNEDMTVIFVEWKIGATFPYHQAVGNTRMIGAQVSHMIELIRNDTGLDWDRLHLIGFSLGGHVMGYAGRNLRRKGLLVPRISAIDPASPYYENKHPDRRIDPSDAAFVDVMHTDTKTLRVNGFGTTQLMGHIDFFPNGGFDQPGCWKFDKSVVQYLACSHYRSLRYYIESINSPCPYYGYPCKETYDDYRKTKCSTCSSEGCARMGYHAKMMNQNSSTGYRYYLQTHSEESFCAHHYQVTIYTGSGMLKDLHGVVTIEFVGSLDTESVDIEKKYYASNSMKTSIILLKKDIGIPRTVQVKHDRYFDIWFLESVVIRPMRQEDKVYVACFNRWLNSAQNQVNVFPGTNSLCKKGVIHS